MPDPNADNHKDPNAAAIANAVTAIATCLQAIQQTLATLHTDIAEISKRLRQVEILVGNATIILNRGQHTR